MKNVSQNYILLSVYKQIKTSKMLITHISLDLAESWIHHTGPH